MPAAHPTVGSKSDPLSPHRRSQAVFIRSQDEIKAMAWTERYKIKLRNLRRRIFCCEINPMEVRADVEQQPVKSAPQYRLEATRQATTGYMSRCLSCFRGSGTSSKTAIGIHQNHMLASSLHWMFRVNFIFLFAVMCSIFFLWVMLFAAFIVGAGRMDAECVRVGGAPFGDAGADFSDAFALSWTTFSTVGYGSTYPALGHENDNPTNCLLITLICSLESFLGVLYSGFCGAILFGKVLRIQSHAQVTFSDPIVIRYGKGVQQGHHEPYDTDSDDGIKKIPCPVLEFRVVNRLYGEIGGEIMDATLNVVANVDANDVDPTVNAALSATARNPKSDVSSTVDSHSHMSVDSNSTGTDHAKEKSQKKHSKKFAGGNALSSLLKRQYHHAVDEDPSARLVNKRIFSKMMIESSDHPFFKRVWLGRHILDDTSPILTPRVRRQIRRNQGYWPERLNTYQGVRESMQFNQILVSFNGVSNVSASDVYAQKIYDFVDINIGYQFVNILYKDTDGTLKVDTDLVNDVREQYGGGGEPLILGE
eukprot:Nitzschia sp. Nitz4//scaffold178_size73299//61035//62764//NITZ4_005718-RA/size73299-processed-gene-0.36-mRNA-1//-1//CDS//3329539179//4247//frame0